MRNTAMYKSFLACGSAVLVTALAAPAQAQEAGDSGGLEEILVTAERRQASINDVGMSITALDSDVLEATRVTSIDDLTRVVPGLTVSKSRSGLPIYTLRGIGFNVISSSSTSPVGTYVDQAAYVYPAMNAGPFFDIERVEVLKGPQGTLYGRNTTGGLVDIITNKPGKDFAAGITAEFGNYATRNFEGFVNIPIADAARLRVAMRSEDSDTGWQKSFTRPDDRLGEIHKFGIRGQLALDVGSDLDVLIGVNYWRDRSDTTAQQYITYVTNPYTANPAIWRAAPHFAAFDTAWRASADRSNSMADWLAPGPQGALTRYGTAGKGLYSNAMGELRRDDDFVSATMNATWRLTDDVELISLTGYNRLSSFAPHAVSGTPFEFSVFVDGGKTTNFFQELRLQGETSRLQWTIGGYYARDTVNGQAPGLFDDLGTVSNLRGLFNAAQNCAAPGGGAPGSLVSGAGTGLPGGCVQGPGGTFNPNGYTAAQISEGFRNGASHGNQKGTLWSLFAHLDFKLTDTLSAVGGVRYSEQLQTGTSCAGTLDPTQGPVFSNQYYIWNTSFRYLYYIRNAGKLPPPGPIGPTGCLTYDATTNSFGLVNQRLDENNVAWQLGLNWKFADNQLLYATVSKGFLAGVLPSTSSNSAVQLTPVKQEQLMAYEAGAKLSLLDRKVRATVSGFYYDYRDKQVNAFFPDIIFTALPVLINIPKSRAYGIDASVSAKLSPALEATLSGTWLETEVTELPACVGTQLFGCGRDSRAQPLDYKGFEFAYAPKYQASGILSYDNPVSEKLGLRATVSASYQSRSFGLLGGDRLPGVGSNLTMKGYATVSASAGLYDLDRKWDATIWVKNLTDEDYATNVIQGQDYYSRNMGMPRTFGASLTYRFN